MRVRLLLDTNLSASDVENLQEIIDTQPSATLEMEGFRVLGARLMGAQPVPEAE